MRLQNMLEIDIIKEVESDYDEFLSPISTIQRQKQKIENYKFLMESLRQPAD